MSLFRSSKIRSVHPPDLEALRAEGAAIVDVRSEREWSAGHLPYAKHIPVEQLNARIGELDPAVLTVLVCRSGARSGSVAKALDRHGYLVANLAGGMVSCKLAGLSIKRDGGGAGVVA